MWRYRDFILNHIFDLYVGGILRKIQTFYTFPELFLSQQTYMYYMYALMINVDWFQTLKKKARHINRSHLFIIQELAKIFTG